MGRPFIYDDAGRPPGLPLDLPDCAARAVAITTGLTYETAAAELLLMARRSSFERGVPHAVTQTLLHGLGWGLIPGDWRPLAVSQLPAGRLVAFVDPVDDRAAMGHVTAIIDEAVRDLHDCRAGRVIEVCMPARPVIYSGGMRVC